MSTTTFPPHLHVLIARRMQPRSLCRFRQTCKMIDQLIETNRSRIATRHDVIQWTFLVCVKESEPATPQFYVSREIILHSLKLHQFLYFETSIYKIEDPYLQLSGIRFNTVYADMLISEEHRGAGYNMDVLCQMDCTFTEKILPVAAKMNLECDMIATYFCTNFGTLCSLVRFSKLHVVGLTFAYSSYLACNLSHCSDIDLHHFSDQPESEKICEIIGKATRAKLGFDLRINVFEILQNFLLEIRHARSSVPNLECFQIYTGVSSSEALNLQDLQKLWKGKNHWGPIAAKDALETTILKYVLNTGVAIIVYDLVKIDVCIISEDNRESLLEYIYPYIFDYLPYDCSYMAEKFTQAESDTDAIDILRNSYPDIVEWRPDYDEDD